MSTANFDFHHRCIVVTDDDYEYGNIPELRDDFKFWEIKLNGGYYADACITAMPKNENIYDICGYVYGYDITTQKELFQIAAEELGISSYKCRKICGNVNGLEIEEYIEQAQAALIEFAADQELQKVDQYLNSIKTSYGYTELKLAGRFSNGSAVYEIA